MVSDSESAGPASPPQRNSSSLHPIMVLLVDDQVMIGEAVRRILKAEKDIDFHFCSEAKDALDIAADLCPLVILQDLVMPAASGIDLVRQYRHCEVLHETPVVVLSTKDEAETKRAAFEAGANDYLVKLPDPIELVARIRHHASACLARRQLNDALHALRESQQQLVERNVALESLNEQKNRLLGMAAHDLRNPLGVIQAYSEFLATDASEALDESQREFISEIRSASEFMLRLLNDLLDVSTIESGRLRLDPKPTDFAALARHNVDLNSVLAAKKNIGLSIECEPDLPTLPVDAGKIEQVFNNLIGNALKYSHSHTQVSVDIRKIGDEIEVSIRDQGQGIPAEDIPKLFKAFGRANVQSTAGEQSTGLGLAIVRKIVDGHGGQIWVESSVGKGSTFSFALPINPKDIPANQS